MLGANIARVSGLGNDRHLGRHEHGNCRQQQNDPPHGHLPNNASKIGARPAPVKCQEATHTRV